MIHICKVVPVLVLSAVIFTGCNTRESSLNQVSLTVSAASDLMPAFEAIGRLFEKETGYRVSFNFGSTGMLAQQIEQGAAVDLFAAANIEYVDELERLGLILTGTKKLYAQGRITIWVRQDSKIKPGRIEDLQSIDIKRIAIANPDHAPYGIAAREAIISAGLWDKLSVKLVFGENVMQALQFAETGNVDAAIVALSLSKAAGGHWSLIPAEMHRPMNQALAVIKSTRHESEARRLAEFILGEKGRSVLNRYGFVLPGGESRE